MPSEASPQTDVRCLSKSLSLSKSEQGERFDNDPDPDFDFDFDFEGSMVPHCNQFTLWQRSCPLKDLVRTKGLSGNDHFPRATHRLRRGD